MQVNNFNSLHTKNNGQSVSFAMNPKVKGALKEELIKFTVGQIVINGENPIKNYLIYKTFYDGIIVGLVNLHARFNFAKTKELLKKDSHLNGFRPVLQAIDNIVNDTANVFNFIRKSGKK